MLENKKMTIDGDKIHIVSIQEIIKQTEYYKKMQRIENARKEALP
jgi:hypothetical protein